MCISYEGVVQHACMFVCGTHICVVYCGLHVCVCDTGVICVYMCVCLLCPHLFAQVPALTSLTEQMTLWLYQLITKLLLLSFLEA